MPYASESTLHLEFTSNLMFTGKCIMPSDIQAPIRFAIPNKEKKGDQVGMAFLKLVHGIFNSINCIKIQICLIKCIKSKDSLASATFLSDNL